MNFFKIIFKFFYTLLYPFKFIIKKILEEHDKTLEKKIKREMEISLSHELKTPLTSILAYSEILMENLKNDPENYGYSEIINRKSRELLRLIENMLTLFVLDFNPRAYNIDYINLTNIIIDATNEFKKTYDSSGKFILNINVKPDIYVNGNERLIKKIILELLINCYLYSKENEMLVIFLSVNKYNDCVEILIQDNGIGIKEKYQKRVFDRFFRIENVENAKSSGLGIGLTIVKKVCELFNGTIDLKSKENKGTTIVITLPLE